MQNMADWLPWVLGGISTLVMWGAQVSPHQAVSNASAWMVSLGWKNPPKWLESPDVDRVVRHVAAIFLAASLLYVLTQLFEVGAMQPGPKILFALCALGIAVSIGWNFASPRLPPRQETEQKAPEQNSKSSIDTTVVDLAKLPNTELLAYTMRVAAQMRTFESNSDQETSRHSMQPLPSGLSQEQRMQIYSQRATELSAVSSRIRTEFQNTYLHPAIQLRDELKSRLRKLGIFAPDALEITLAGNTIKLDLVAFEGQLAGPHPISNAANYLEQLARKLP